MSPFEIPADKKIDPVKLDAWIHMNTVSSPVHSPGPAFIYARDLKVPEAAGEIDPARLQSLIEEKTVSGSDPEEGVPFIYLDDLLEGFKGTRLEPWAS